VRELNTKIKVFPNNMFARNLGFHEREFFEVDRGRRHRRAPADPVLTDEKSRPSLLDAIRTKTVRGEIEESLPHGLQ
jgi:hypothetical protein